MRSATNPGRAVPPPRFSRRLAAPTTRAPSTAAIVRGAAGRVPAVTLDCPGRNRATSADRWRGMGSGAGASYSGRGPAFRRLEQPAVDQADHLAVFHHRQHLHVPLLEPFEDIGEAVIGAD